MARPPADCRDAVCYGRPVSPPAPPPAAATDDAACREFLDALSAFARLHAIKMYRVVVPLSEPVPVLPCLDHEAKLHEGIPPHAAAYIEDIDGGQLHEVVCIPSRRRIEVDVVSTAGEHTEASHARLVERLRRRFPRHRIVIDGPSWLRGDRRVARACRARAPLREILTGRDFPGLYRAIDQLRIVSSVMEKQSRVASWSVRTVTGPLLALGGFVSYQVLDMLTGRIGPGAVQGLQYLTVGVLGAVFLYLGLKAVHLTEVAGRIWKRSAEYQLILRDRERLASAGKTAVPDSFAALTPRFEAAAEARR